MAFGTELTPVKLQKIADSFSRTVSLPAPSAANNDTTDVDDDNEQQRSASSRKKNTGHKNSNKRNSHDNRLVEIGLGSFVMALRRMDAPPIGSKVDKTYRPNKPPLIIVGPDSVIKTDKTKQSFANLSKFIRDPTSGEAKATIPGSLKDSTQTARQQSLASSLSAASNPLSDQPNYRVASHGRRTLLLEDVLHIKIGTPVNIFFRH